MPASVLFEAGVVPSTVLGHRLYRLPWIVMAIFAVVNATTNPPYLSGNAGLLVSILLALAAGAGSPVAIARLHGRRTALVGAMVVIALFVGSQIGSRFDFGRTRNVAGLDFSAYYLAGKAIESDVAKRMYYIPTYADGRMKFAGPIDRQSSWQQLASRFGIAETMQFNYPPFATIVAKPFTTMPFERAYAVWTVFMSLLLGASVFLIVHMFHLPDWPAIFLAAVIATFSLGPVRTELYFGQVGPLLLFLWVAGIWFLQRQKWALSALCFALATMLKLTPVLVVPAFVLARKWRWLGAYMGCMIALALVGLWNAGWENHRVFITQVLPSMSCGSAEFENRSIMALVQGCYLGGVPLKSELPAYLPNGVCGIAKAISLAYFACMLVMYRRWSKRDLTYTTLMMAPVSLLVSPISWSHHYVLAVLPLLFMWCSHQEMERSRWLLYTTLVVTLLTGTDAFRYLLVLIRNPLADLALAASHVFLLTALLVLHARERMTVSTLVDSRAVAVSS